MKYLIHLLLKPNFNTITKNDADGVYLLSVDVIDNVTTTIENTGNDYNLSWFQIQIGMVLLKTVQSFDESGGSDTESFNLTVISIDDKPFVENN